MVKFIGEIAGSLTRCRIQIGLSLLAIIFASACKSDYPAGSTARIDRATRKQLDRLRLRGSKKHHLEKPLPSNGTLAAYDQTTASVKVPGRLRTITVDLGSVVRRGQVIAQVEPQDYNLRVQQAEAGLGSGACAVGLIA